MALLGGEKNLIADVSLASREDSQDYDYRTVYFLFSFFFSKVNI